MTITSYGTFTAYSPVLDSSVPQSSPLRMCRYLQSTTGDDFYDLVKTLPPNLTYVAVAPSGIIASANNDPSMIFPVDCTFVSIDMVGNPNSLIRKAIDLYTGEVTDPPANQVVITFITQAQGKLALHNRGNYNAALAYVAAADVPTQIWFTDSGMWTRDSDEVNNLATALGMSSAQMDALFVAASVL